jgi:hypothetical protein
VVVVALEAIVVDLEDHVEAAEVAEAVVIVVEEAVEAVVVVVAEVEAAVLANQASKVE